jgi:hypothetical protein
MIEVVLVIVSKQARSGSHLIRASFEHVEKVVHSRDDFLKGAVTPYSSIAFSTLSCLIEGLKQLLEVS